MHIFVMPTQLLRDIKIKYFGNILHKITEETDSLKLKRDQKFSTCVLLHSCDKNSLHIDFLVIPNVSIPLNSKHNIMEMNTYTATPYNSIMASKHTIIFDNILAGTWGGQGTEETNFKMDLKEIQHKDTD